MTSTKEEILLLNTILLAGKLMSESGSEAYRVETTMHHIAKNAGRDDCVNYVTLTGLFVCLKNDGLTQIENINKREINIEKVDHVNRLSREFAEKKQTLPQLYEALRAIEKQVPDFSLPLKILAAGFVSSTLMYIYGGLWGDMLITFLVGMIGYSISDFVKRNLKVAFIHDFLAGLAIGSLAYFAFNMGFGYNPDFIIIGAVMPLVPGVAITNAIRDILAGHILNGTSRLMEAIFTASAIATGIAIALKLFL